MALAGGEGLWCGASLRPWQILHSRLARMHTCALLERDVWELMDETVAAASPLISEYKKEELQIWDGDDGELWRHGGLMEARIRDWLTSKIEEETQEAPSIMHPYCSSTTFSSEFSEGDDSRLEEQIAAYTAYGDDYSYNGGANTAVATRSSEFSETWDSTYAVGVYDELEEEEEEGYIGTNMANAAIMAAPLDTEMYYCQFSEDLQASDIDEEDEALCAVCLEKLYNMNHEELQGFSINNITSLPCRHSFHSHCLSPWLSASSLCPCCRAPISLSFSLNLEAPPDLGVGNNCSDRVQLDMMGLVAEMEAALDRFGLLS